jgi:hypothetical protein
MALAVLNETLLAIIIKIRIRFRACTVVLKTYATHNKVRYWAVAGGVIALVAFVLLTVEFLLT